MGTLLIIKVLIGEEGECVRQHTDEGINSSPMTTIKSTYPGNCSNAVKAENALFDTDLETARAAWVRPLVATVILWSWTAVRYVRSVSVLHK